MSTNPYQSPTTIDDGRADGAGFLHADFATTALGLRLVYFGVLLLLLIVVLGVFSGIFRVPIPILVLFTGGGMGLLLTFIGPLLCLSVPSYSGLRRWVIAAVATPLAGIPLVLAGEFLSIPLLAMFGWFLGSAIFLAFLIQLAKYIGRLELAKRGSVILVSGIVFPLIMTPITLIPGHPMSLLAIIIQVVIGLGLLILFVSYVNLIHSLAKVLRSPPTETES